MPDSLQLFTAQSGQLSAKIVFPDGTARHLHSLVDPSIESELFGDLCFWGDVIIFAGVGLGYHIEKKIETISPDATLIVMDFYGELLTYCGEHALRGLSNRIVYLSASNISARRLEALSLIKAAPEASIQIVKHPASYFAHEEFYASALSSLFLAQSRPRRKLSAPPRRALLFHGNFFLEEEAQSALRGEGIEPIVFSYNRPRDAGGYEDELQRIIQARKPDFVLSINMKGFDGSGAVEGITARLGVPLVVWFVDDPRPILLHRIPYVKNHMLAACWERSFLPYVRGAGFSAAAFVPLAADPALFSPGGTSATTSVAVGFVGTAMVDRYAGDIKDKFLWSQDLEPLVESLSQRLLSDPAMAVQEEISASAKAMGLTLPFTDVRNTTWLATYCIHTASMKKRKRIIGGLLGEGIETFGDPDGWKALLGPTVSTHPDIDYRRGLCGVYRDIYCNVNITSCQMPTAVNQRVFDVPCCGSFVLSDDQPDLHALFDVGREAIAYENLTDLKEKLLFYADHGDARRTIIKAAQQRIIHEHTYIHRLRRILQLIRA